jgi:hypothetical protein
VAIPKLVGETVAVARRELAAQGLRGKFAWSDGPALNCSDALPSARVISQSPEAGEMTRANHAVVLSASAYVQAGCGQPSTSRPCEPSQLALRILEGTPDFAGGSEYELVTVNVVHAWGRRPCSVDSTLNLAVDQPQGELASRLRGNPAGLELHADLDRGEKMEAGWTLGSWCGSRRSVVAVATLEGLSATRFLRRLPYGDGCPLLDMYSLYKG